MHYIIENIPRSLYFQYYAVYVHLLWYIHCHTKGQKKHWNVWTLTWKMGTVAWQSSQKLATFPAKWRLRNEHRNSILMMRHYPDLCSASDWLNHISHMAWPIRSAPQIWLVTHQYGISVLVSQASFARETSGSVVKCRLFSLARKWGAIVHYWLLKLLTPLPPPPKVNATISEKKTI